jgi:glycosyltransferase involved in cell wall biosynthesis
VVSDVELSYAQKYYGIPINQLMYLPILSSRLFEPFGPLNNDKSTNACFIGNFKHVPNRDAVHFLRYQLWPHINKALSDQGNANSECHIYGAYMDAKMERLHNPSIGFHMMGRVDDVYSTMAGYGVLLAPLRFGAGVKGKILDAISVELPVVTTPTGSEGLSVHLDGVDFPGYVTKTVEEFKQSAVKCLSTSAQNRWNFPDHKKLVQRLDTEYGNAFIAQVNNLIEGKNGIQHPIKLMLEQNSQLAHRYLSKYIQLKNES